MGFKEELSRSLETRKVRKKGSDNVNLRLPRTIIHSLQWISVGYSSALYFGGKKFGKEIISKEIKGKDVKSILKEIGSFFNSQGVGKFQVKEISEKTATVRIIESYNSFAVGKIGKPICFFEAGIIAGILEGKLKKNITVNEVLCGGLGDEVDEFLIKL